MKIAVIFTNHLRTLPYIKDRLKTFYPAGTDYFLCTWNENHCMYTTEQIENLMKEQNITSLYEFCSSRYAYQELNPNDLLEVKEFFNFTGVNILTGGEFYEWYNENLSEFFGKVHSGTLYEYFRRFIKQKAWELVENIRSKYDLIVFHRCDLIPSSDTIKFTDFNLKKCDLYTYNFKIYKGLLHFDDNIFIGTPETLQSIFENSFTKIKSLSSNLIYRDKFSDLKSHRLEAALILLSNTVSSSKMPFSYNKVTLDNIHENGAYM